MEIFKETILSNWVIVRIGQNLIEELLPLAIKHTALKVNHSMDEGQDGVVRPQDVKFQKQLMGTLAEKATAKYVEKILLNNKISDDWKVLVYDDVRKDFTYSTDEYDLKIVSNQGAGQNEFIFESRSSIVHDRPFDVAMRSFHIIGPYFSGNKRTEPFRDFYARPLYVYKDYEKEKYLPSRFQDLLSRQRIVLYIVGGCNRREMEEKGYIVDMRQGNTVYLGVDILAGHDAFDFGQLIAQRLEQTTS